MTLFIAFILIIQFNLDQKLLVGVIVLYIVECYWRDYIRSKK